MLTLIFLFPVAGCDTYSFSWPKKGDKIHPGFVNPLLLIVIYSLFQSKSMNNKDNFKFFLLNVNVCITSFYSLCPPGWVFPPFSDPHFLKRGVASPGSADISQWYSQFFFTSDAVFLWLLHVVATLHCQHCLITAGSACIHSCINVNWLGLNKWLYLAANITMCSLNNVSFFTLYCIFTDIIEIIIKHICVGSDVFIFLNIDVRLDAFASQRSFKGWCCSYTVPCGLLLTLFLSFS